MIVRQDQSTNEPAGGPASPGIPASRNRALCNAILANALLSGSQAIRLVPVDSGPGGVEYERDGQWQPAIQIPVKAIGQVINRFKVMAALDIARMPVQDGELHVRLKGTRRVRKIRCEAAQPLRRNQSAPGGCP